MYKVNEDDLYAQVKAKFGGNLADVCAYVTNGVFGTMGEPETVEQVVVVESLKDLQEMVYGEIVEQYMKDHGYKRDGAKNRWVKNEEKIEKKGEEKK